MKLELTKQGTVFNTDVLHEGLKVVVRLKNGGVVIMGVIREATPYRVKVNYVVLNGNRPGNIITLHAEDIEHIEIDTIVTGSEYERLKGRINELERQGGTLNLERSWKTKYRLAWERANRRLIEAGLEPVKIRRGAGELDDPDIVESSLEQTSLFDIMEEDN